MAHGQPGVTPRRGQIAGAATPSAPTWRAIPYRVRARSTNRGGRPCRTERSLSVAQSMDSKKVVTSKAATAAELPSATPASARTAARHTGSNGAEPARCKKHASLFPRSHALQIPNRARVYTRTAAAKTPIPRQLPFFLGIRAVRWRANADGRTNDISIALQIMLRTASPSAPMWRSRAGDKPSIPLAVVGEKERAAAKSSSPLSGGSEMRSPWGGMRPGRGSGWPAQRP